MAPIEVIETTSKLDEMRMEKKEGKVNEGRLNVKKAHINSA
jgi:hypothetical protein